MAGFEQHGQHLAPQVGGLYRLGRLDLAARCRLFVGDIGLFKGCAKKVVQVRHVRRREQRPGALFHHAAHEQIGNPVGGIHVVRAAAVVTGVLAQLQELFDIEVPGFQVGADGAFALAALVHGHGRVVDHFEEGHHPLRLAIGALDVAAQRAHACPVVAQAASKLGQQGVFLDGLIDAIEVVGYCCEVAAGQLRTPRAAVEQRGRAGHEVEAGKNLIELDGACFAVDLIERESHGHAHEESLGQLDARFLDVQEVAVIQGLQAEVIKLQVAVGLEGGAQALQVVLQQTFIQQLVLHTLLDELREIVHIALRHFGLSDFAAQHLTHDRVQQQARCGVGVVRILLDECACGKNGRLVDLFHRYAVIQVAHGFRHDGLGADV